MFWNCDDDKEKKQELSDENKEKTTENDPDRWTGPGSREAFANGGIQRGGNPVPETLGEGRGT